MFPLFWHLTKQFPLFCQFFHSYCWERSLENSGGQLVRLQLVDGLINLKQGGTANINKAQRETDSWLLMDDDNDGGSDDSDDVYNVWWKGCLSTICDGIVCV